MKSIGTITAIGALLAACGGPEVGPEPPYDGTGHLVDGVCRADVKPERCADTRVAELARGFGGCAARCGAWDVIAYTGLSGVYCAYEPATGALAAVTVYTDIPDYCQGRSFDRTWGEGPVECDWGAIVPCPD